MSNTKVLASIFNSIGIVAVLIIIFGALLSVFTLSGATWITTIVEWFYDSYLFVVSCGIVAVLAFTIGSIFELKNEKDKRKIFSRVGVITGILALISIPSTPIIGQLFCTKNALGTGCDLSSIGMIVYFVGAAVALGVVSITAFILSATYERNQKA